MRLAFYLGLLPSVAVALRQHEDDELDVEADNMRMNAGLDSHSSGEADTGVGLGTRLEAGAVLRERYVLTERITADFGPGKVFPDSMQRQFSGPTHLGAGSFGDTWKAYDSHMGINVAVKIFYDRRRDVYLTWRSASAHQLQALRESAQECALIKNMMKSSSKHVGSSRICQCYEEHVSDAQGQDRPVFLVLELCGRELGDVLTEMAAKGAANAVQARSWAKQALEGVAFIGMLTPPLIHHDLKPGNIVVNGANLKIIDWGAAIEATRKHEFARSVYTPVYAAPEVLEGHGRAFAQPAHSYDVYALGLVYIQMLCPQVSHRQWMNVSTGLSLSLHAQIIRTWMGLCPSVTIDPSISQDVELIARMLSRKPQERPAPLELLDLPHFKNISTEHTTDFLPAENVAPNGAGKFQIGQKVVYYGAAQKVGAIVANVKQIKGEFLYDLEDPDGRPVTKSTPEYAIVEATRDAAPSKTLAQSESGKFKIGQEVMYYGGVQKVRAIVANVMRVKGEYLYDLVDPEGRPVTKSSPEYAIVEPVPGVDSAPEEKAAQSESGKFNIGQEVMYYGGAQKVRAIVANVMHVGGEFLYDLEDPDGRLVTKSSPEYAIVERIPGVDP